jgi:UDP-N-acetylmuramate: L-alanyl-gamma-D-glutamyl-meso-diaminopimelate ligase
MNIHFIGIGGSVMHNIAIREKQNGNAVTGSDDAWYDPSESRLKEHGLLPQQAGWFPEKITSDSQQF